MRWGNIYPGCYQISAKAITDKNYSKSSSVVNVQVGNDCVKAPYMGIPIKIPGTIEVENYDLGGQNIAYYDIDIANNGGKYRISEEDDSAQIDPP